MGADRSDLHTHSNRTDGLSNPEEMAGAAHAAGLRVWGLADHVRASTTWVPEYVVATRRLRREGLEVRCGVEAKILDSSGRLDLPPEIDDLDYVLIADHQFPGSEGPLHPDQVRKSLAQRRIAPTDVISQLVEATVRAIGGCPKPAIVAHPFSILPKIGLHEDQVAADHLAALAAACVERDAGVEVNEKWCCPSPRVAAALRRRDVRMVQGSDAHSASEIGRHAYADEVAATLGIDSVTSVSGETKP